MPLRVVTPPAESPVSLTEAKAHLRLEEDVDDAYVLALIDAARLHVEKSLGRALVLQTVELKTEPVWCDESVVLPGGGLADPPQVQVRYLDTAGVEQTLDAAAFFTVSGGEARPGRLYLAANTYWPEMAARADALRVQYRVGWANAAAVPQSLRHAVLLMVSQLYEHRTPETESLTHTTLDALMAPYRFSSI